MIAWRRALCAAAFAAAAASAWACGEDAGDAGDAECPRSNPECKEIATVEAGAQAVVKRRCVDCHGRDLSGSLTKLPGVADTIQGEPVELYPPNLTNDETGIGTWSDEALAVAIRSGIDEESQALCPQMTHYSQMSDFEVYSIVKYLRDIPKVRKNVPRSVCPPTKTKEQQGSTR
ncbi:MAG: cytochrome c [Labilithrix sp.]|nr:cytochrome c [Labilithrix sp.]MCW5838015.1 cytochrome c [Labilithrix sp.]